MASESRVPGGISTFAVRHPWIALALVGLLTVLFAAFLPRVRLDSSIETFFLKEDPDREIYDRFKETFGEDELVVIVWKPAAGKVFTKDVLEKVDRISKEIEDYPDELGVDRVMSLTTVDDVYAIEGGFEVEKLVPEITDDAAALARMRERALRNPIYVGNIVSDEADVTAINVLLEYRPGDTAYKKKLVDRIRDLVQRERGDDQMFYTGVPVVTADMNDYMRRDLALYIPITIAVMGIILWLTFRTVTGMVLPLVTVGLATFWMLGFIGMTGRTIVTTTSIVPSLVLAVGIAHAIHVVSEFYQLSEPDPFLRLGLAMQHIAKPVFRSGMTTCIGFASLATSDVTQVREFGVYSAFGIAAATALAVLFVPAILVLRKTAPVPSPASADTMVPGLTRFGTAVCTRPYPVLLAGVVVLALSALGMTRIVVDTDWIKNFKEDSEPRRALAFIQEHLQGQYPAMLFVESKDGTSVLEPDVLAYTERLEAFMVADPVVAWSVSVGGYLRNMNEAMHGDDPKRRVLPESRDLAEQYLLLYDRPNEMIRFVSNDRKQLAIAGRTTETSSANIINFSRSLKEMLAEKGDRRFEVSLTGSPYLSSKTADAVALGQVTSLGVACATIFVIFFMLFRSVKLGVIAIIPNLLPILMTFGMMGYFGVPLNAATSIMASMALGIVDDDTIHFLERYRERRGTHTTMEAILYTISTTGRQNVWATITNTLGFLVLCLSSFAPVQSLGILAAFTMVTALIADLVLLPALLIVFDRAPAPSVQVAAA